MPRQPKHSKTTVHDPSATALRTLAKNIRAEHRACLDPAKNWVEHSRRCGELLAQARTRVRRGDWGAWIAANCGFTDRIARIHMQTAKLNEAERQELAWATEKLRSLPRFLNWS